LLDLHTNQSYPDAQQAYAVGYLEGAITSQRSYEFLMNNFGGSIPYSATLLQYLKDNLNWIQSQIKANPTSNYWYHVNLLYQQQMGGFAGYSYAAKNNQQFDFFVYYAANLQGDLLDLCPALGCIDLDGTEFHERRSDGHCSVLIKPLSNWTDIYMGHTTWAGFNSMTRIYKRYDFPFRVGPNDNTTVPGRHIAFSSYPACFQSTDDFYQTSPSTLVVVETTIENNNASLWDYITPNTVLEWMRITLANRLSNSGPQWVDWLSLYNSGTYNNEWMVLDYKLFTPGTPPSAGLLYVLEQMPGPYIVFADQTQWLINYGYWASYNRPFYPLIYNISNQWALYDEYGDHYSWNMTARAQIFRRNQTMVVDENSYRKLMRYNDFESDPISIQGCNYGASGSNAISERGDLTSFRSDCINSLQPQNEGGIDLKYTNSKGMTSSTLSVTTQSGPTYDQQMPFVWSTSPLSFVPHDGMPDKWQFPYITYQFDV
jgi:hypothetical protein